MTGEGLKGHSFGNLFITALSMVTGDFEKAIAESSKVLAIRGRVLPSTLDKVTLVGEFTDGTRQEGETNITGARKPLRSIHLKPDDCKACPEALDAISSADLVIMGPGSLYTSILPNLLIQDIRDSIVNSDAYKVYICNAMTQPGETVGFSAWDHLRTIIEHTDPRIVDAVYVNTAKIPEPLFQRYREVGALPVKLDLDKILDKGYELVTDEVLKSDSQVRHDAEKIMKSIIDHYMKNEKKLRG